MKQQLNKRSHESWKEGHYIGKLEGGKGNNVIIKIKDIQNKHLIISSGPST